MDEPPTSLDDLELRGVGSEREAIFKLNSSEPATKEIGMSSLFVVFLSLIVLLLLLSPRHE
jgi:hypothetical protein